MSSRPSLDPAPAPAESKPHSNIRRNPGSSLLTIRLLFFFRDPFEIFLDQMAVFLQDAFASAARQRQFGVFRRGQLFDVGSDGFGRLGGGLGLAVAASAAFASLVGPSGIGPENGDLR